MTEICAAPSFVAAVGQVVKSRTQVDEGGRLLYGILIVYLFISEREIDVNARSLFGRFCRSANARLSVFALVALALTSLGGCANCIEDQLMRVVVN